MSTASEDYTKSGKPYLPARSLSLDNDVWQTDHKRLHDRRLTRDGDLIPVKRSSSTSLAHYPIGAEKSSLQPYQIAKYQQHIIAHRSIPLSRHQLNKKYTQSIKNDQSDNDRSYTKYRYFYIPNIIDNIAAGN